jgi:hypothetical protein
VDQAADLTWKLDASWLFSKELYHPGDADLNAFNSSYDHYVRVGDREGRAASLFFDPAIYLAQLSPEQAKIAARIGPCRHFLEQLRTDLPEPRTSIYFDPAWYLARNPSVSAGIGQSRADWI